MSLKDSVEESVGWVRQRLEKIRLRYLDAMHDAEREGGSRLEELKRQVEQLGPGLRHLVDDRFEALQYKLDEINQRLAEEAVPEERKSRVGRLALERKAASAARKASTVVRSRSRSTASEGATSKGAPSASAEARGAEASESRPAKTRGRSQKTRSGAKAAPVSRRGKSTGRKPRKPS